MVLPQDYPDGLYQREWKTRDIATCQNLNIQHRVLPLDQEVASAVRETLDSFWEQNLQPDQKFQWQNFRKQDWSMIRDQLIDHMIGILTTPVLLPEQRSNREGHSTAFFGDRSSNSIHSEPILREMKLWEMDGHSPCFSEITLKLAQMMNIHDDQLPSIYRGALLHDIGKLAIPENIILHHGPLDENAWRVVRQHPFLGYQLINCVHGSSQDSVIPYYHHEKWDGSGYPLGLREEEIPLEARIFAVVDVWDALSSDRPYRPAWTQDQSQEYILQQAGYHFDPQVIESFFDLQNLFNNSR